jgi:ribonuclease P/MRP protein subunit RPP1
MKITDAAVWPYPAGDSSVRRLALEARELGFDSIVAIDTPPSTFEGVAILSGILVREGGMKEVMSRMKRAKGTPAVISVQAGDAGFNRAVAGLRGVHILRGIHAADKNGFDHVTAKMAADNRVAIDIDLSALIAARGIARQRALQRYRDVMVLQNRFEFPLTVSSNARSVLDLRATREISGLLTLLDMDLPVIERALNGVAEVMTPVPPAVRVIP